MQQVLNEDCALFQLDILARNEDHLIAQLRCVLDGVDAFKLHQHARFLYARVLYRIFPLSEKDPVKFQQKLGAVCPGENLDLAVQAMGRDDFSGLQQFFFHRVSSALSKTAPEGATYLI